MLTAQPCPAQTHAKSASTPKISTYTQDLYLHPKSSLPYDLNVYFHREGMKLHVFVRRDFWVSGLPCPLTLDSLPWPACLSWRHLSWRRLPACLRCKCHLGG